MDEDIRTAKRNDLSELLALYDELPLVLQFLRTLQSGMKFSN